MLLSLKQLNWVTGRLNVKEVNIGIDKLIVESIWNPFSSAKLFAEIG